MPKKKITNSVSSITRHDTRAEFVTLTGLAAGGSLGVAVGEKVYRYLKSPDPLVIQVMKSVLDNGTHFVEFKAANQTLHGIYIERLSVDHPHSTVGHLTILLRETVQGNGIQLPSVQWVAQSTPALVPQYIEPGGVLDFAVKVAKVPQTRNTRPYATLKVDFSRLDEQDPTIGRKQNFRLRW
jgi:hypothetical protein